MKTGRENVPQFKLQETIGPTQEEVSRKLWFFISYRVIYIS
jgi:hypothetical protein